MSSNVTESSEDKSFLEEERAAIEQFNRGGIWQIVQIVVLFLSTGSDIQALNIAFIGFQPKFGCIDGDNVTAVFKSTNIFNDECKVFNATKNSSSGCIGGFRYDVNRDETIVSEWDLICDKAYLSEISQLLYTVGMGVGSAFISPISDRLGRKWPYLVLRSLYVLLAFGLALSPNVLVFMVIRFFTGAVGMAFSLVRFVYLIELSSIRLRPFVTILVGVLWALELCLQAGLGQLMRGLNWRYYQLVISIPTLTLFLDFFLLKESLLWLYANGKKREASKLWRIVMKRNGISENALKASENQCGNQRMDKDRVDNKPDFEGTVSYSGPSDVTSAYGARSKSMHRKLNVIDMLKNKTTRKIVPVICFAWFVNSLVYYGIFLMSYAMAGDRVLNFFLSSVVEMPSCLALYLCLRFLGRKKPLVGLHGLCAVSLLLAGIFNFTLSGNTKVTVMQVVTFIGKFGISASFTLIYVYTTEVFPTNFRSSGLGMGSVTARFGSFLSPFSGVLVRELPWGPGIIFGGLCLVLTCILFMAPETRHRSLPQSIEEIEAWKNDPERKNGPMDGHEMTSKLT